MSVDANIRVMRAELARFDDPTLLIMDAQLAIHRLFILLVDTVEELSERLEEP